MLKTTTTQNERKEHHPSGNNKERGKGETTYFWKTEDGR
jgi:hypothetical protein